MMADGLCVNFRHNNRLYYNTIFTIITLLPIQTSRFVGHLLSNRTAITPSLMDISRPYTKSQHNILVFILWCRYHCCRLAQSETLNLTSSHKV